MALHVPSFLFEADASFNRHKDRLRNKFDVAKV